MNSYHYRLLPGSLCCLLALSAAGCASVPAQEMSDARQAIHAAQSAGAAQVVPGTLSEAQSRLKAAEEALRLAGRRHGPAAALAGAAAGVVAMGWCLGWGGAPR